MRRKRRNLVRRFVLRTNETFILAWVYRCAYRLSVWLLVRCVYDSRVMRGIYSRNSYADGTFEAGLSDVDTVVVYRDDLPCPVLWASIRRLSRRYRVCRALLPVLDRPGVYTESDLLSSLRLGIVRGRTYAWRCESGVDTADCGSWAVAKPDGQGPDRAGWALETFLTLFHANFREFALHGGEPEECLRVSRKITRYLRATGEDFSSIEERDASALLSQMLRQAEAVCGTEEIPAHAFAVVGEAGAGVPAQPLECGATQLPLAVSAVVRETLSGGRVFVLLKSYEPPELAEVLRFVQAQFPQDVQSVFFVSERLWPEVLRRARPLLFYRLRRRRHVLGDDPLERVAAPTAAGILSFFRLEASALLRAPLSLWLAGGRKSPGNPERRLRDLATRLVRLRAFLEEGVLILNVRRYLVDSADSSFERELIESEASGGEQVEYRTFESLLRLQAAARECLARHGDSPGRALWQDGQVNG